MEATAKDTLIGIGRTQCPACVRSGGCEIRKVLLSGKYKVGASDLAFFLDGDGGCRYSEEKEDDDG